MRNQEAVIGLEVHCQLATRTKLFCSCRNTFGAPPNEHTCVVCSAQPGALPVLNGGAVSLAVRACLALGAEVARESVFARKNYFYCDLPKGYQISQFDRPLALGGGVPLPDGSHVRFARIHMEEDAGKAIHDRGERTLVDLNRAGVPLIEMVTEPDLRSSGEARTFLTALREILRYARVSDGDMEKGSLRCDVNVSIHEAGTPLGTKVEIKNLNSIRHVGDAIEHELVRQAAVLEGGGEIVQETRLWDPERTETRTMRSKEDAMDYRYLPEPDLPVLRLTRAFLDARRAELPELPAPRRERFQGELGLSAYDAEVLCADRTVADFFEDTLAHVKGEAKDLSNWITNDLVRALGERDLELARAPLSPASLGALVSLVSGGKLNRNAGREVLSAMLDTGKEPTLLMKELGLEQVSDPAAIEAWCRQALEGRDEVVAQVRAGKLKALGALVGPVMKASGGKAAPAEVRDTLLRLIEAGDGPA